MRFSATSFARLPVWMWRAIMGLVAGPERRRFNAEPISGVVHTDDVAYVDAPTRHQTLDVVAPEATPGSAPVYLYFHGGGWTSGDKAAVRKYCATQAAHGIVVVNANYRVASSAVHMEHIMQDAAAALEWTVRSIREFGGDPDRIVVGGDSAGAQIASLLVAAQDHPELAERYGLATGAWAGRIRGVVQHCGAVDLAAALEPGFVLGRGFIRMLLPHAERRGDLREPVRFLSPIEWVHDDFPEVFVTTSERDYFHRSAIAFVARARARGVPVEVLSYGRESRRTRHTWQQDYRHPESQEVYARLAAFVRRVAGPVALPGRA